jgi:hypothetical protein
MFLKDLVHILQSSINLPFFILLILIFALWYGIFVLKKNPKKLKKIQVRALRFVYDDFCKHTGANLCKIL